MKDEEERRAELESKQYAEMAGVHIPTEQEEMVQSLKDISWDIKALGGVSEKLENFSYDFAEAKGNLEDIKKEFNYWRKSTSSPIYDSQKEMIEFLHSRLPDKDEFKNTDQSIHLQLNEIRASLDAIKNEIQTKKSNFVPIILSIILIVLLIK